jgi:hypothetical protein
VSTFTQVFYFSPDQRHVLALDEAIADLDHDFEERRAFVHPRARAAGEARLALLHHARDLLVEPVPQSYGG